MAGKVTPKADEIVKARRRSGFGAVVFADSRPNLTKPGFPVAEGHFVMMRFREAVEREDFEPVGFESVTVADLEATQEG